MEKMMVDFECHNVNGIREGFQNGIDPNGIADGKPLIYALINMYSRGPLFKECIKAFVDFGLVFEDQILLSVLLDDPFLLEAHLKSNGQAINHKYSLDGTFTPLLEVSLLHICAEYNHLNCAKLLLQYGADVNAKAGIDADGFGGQMPVFHAVNQDANKCLEVLNLLVNNNADLNITVKGLVWGKGYDWETFVPEVNPISYAMMGLLRQFQRTEADIYQVVSILMKAKYGKELKINNVPNKYLNG